MPFFEALSRFNSLLSVLDGKIEESVALSKIKTILDKVPGIEGVVNRGGARQGEEGWTPLQYACRFDLVTCAELLIDHGASINQVIKL